MRIEIEVPDGVSGIWSVQSFTVTEEDARFTGLRAVVTGDPLKVVDPGDYKRLVRGNETIMSNTPMEVRTNSPIIKAAKGNVLINGLGLGMVLTAILEKPELKKVTVIEKEEDVIKLVAPTFKKDPRVQIIHADAFKYKPPLGAIYDAVWHDIWDAICADNLPEMTRLHRKYARRALWQGSWAQSQCRRNRWR